jgi:hypothetical protein
MQQEQTEQEAVIVSVDISAEEQSKRIQLILSLNENIATLNGELELASEREDYELAAEIDEKISNLKLEKEEHLKCLGYTEDEIPALQVTSSIEGCEDVEVIPVQQSSIAEGNEKETESVQESSTAESSEEKVEVIRETPSTNSNDDHDKNENKDRNHTDENQREEISEITNE